MARNKTLQIRLNENEFTTLEQYAKMQKVAMAEVLRDYIKSLKPIVEQSSIQMDSKVWTRPSKT